MGTDVVHSKEVLEYGDEEGQSYQQVQSPSPGGGHSNHRRQPDKVFGEMVQCVTDGTNVNNAVKQTEEWLKRIDKSQLPGKFKTWLYQHGLLPRLLWLFTVYEFPMTGKNAESC